MEKKDYKKFISQNQAHYPGSQMHVNMEQKHGIGLQNKIERVIDKTENSIFLYICNFSLAIKIFP